MVIPVNRFRAAILTGYFDVAESFGLDAQRLIRKFGLHGLNLSDANLLVPAGPVAELLEHSATVAGVEDFGLRMAAKRSLAHLGPRSRANNLPFATPSRCSSGTFGCIPKR